MSNVQVMGVMREAGGLRESLSKTRKHNQEVADAVLNVSGIGTSTGGEVHEDEPRPAYVHQDWPKMIYHADGRDKVVFDQTELSAAKEIGFRMDPYLKPQVFVGDPATEKKALMDTNAQLQAQITKQGEQMAEMAAMLKQLASAKK